MHAVATILVVSCNDSRSDTTQSLCGMDLSSEIYHLPVLWYVMWGIKIN